MLAAQRMLNGLVAAGSRGESEYCVRPHAIRTKTFAAFAEQLGYHYVGHTPGTDATNNPYLSLMVLDACGRYNQRVLSNVLLFPVAAAAFLAVMGYTGDRVMAVGAIWGVLFTFDLIGLAITRRRLNKHLARLARAGTVWPDQRTP